MPADADARAQLLENRLARERRARKEAERLLESKSRELFEANVQLRSLADDLERKVAERTDQLREMRDRAIEGSRVKSAFLANMSHEIRTPLSSIVGMAELLMQSELSGAQAEQATIILQATRSLLGIVNDILDLSKLEAGKLELREQDFDLCQLLSDVGRTVRQPALDKRLELRLLIDPGVPRFLHGDDSRLRQILLNLATNAIKFTDSGQVSISLSIGAETGAELMLRGEVTDTGIGISPADQQRLFMKFSQVDSGTRRVREGTGLGLSICRMLSGLLGGDVGVSSAAGKGSTFWFTVRLQRAGGPAGAAQTPPASRLIGLYLPSATRRLVGAQLRYLGIDHRFCDAGDAAVSAPDGAGTDTLLLIDRQTLPAGELARLQALSREGRCRLLFLPPPSGAADDADDADAPTLAWPLTHHTWLEVLRKPSPSAASTAQSPGPGGARILVAEDSRPLQMIAEAQLRRLGHRVGLAANGQEALQRLQQEPFHLVLMDIHMPELDGIAATRLIRASEDPRIAATPIIALTACAMKGDEDSFLAAGMNDYLVKPLDADMLKSVLQRWLPAPLTSQPDGS